MCFLKFRFLDVFIPLISFSLLGGCVVAQKVHNTPAYPGPIKVVQPDGDTLRVRLFGDEKFNYMTTEDGYTIVENREGYYVYDQSGQERKELPSNVVARNPEDRKRKEKRFLQQFKQ